MAKNLNFKNDLFLLYVIISIIFKVSMTETIEECGTTNYTRGLIVNGSKTQRGEWPFLTALYLIEKLTFFCGGNLISTKHVLTAAHCINRKNMQLKIGPTDVVVLLGAYNLTSRIERGVIQRDVFQIHVHYDWKVYSEQYDADVAIFVLSEIVPFTNYIRPVCLPAGYAAIEGSTGSVVGWGLTENGTYSEFIKHTFSKVLNDAYCYTTNLGTAAISSTRTFCGQGKGGTPNIGDSGGGFYVLYGATWVQVGIVSAIRTNAIGSVDANSIVVYSNVIKFKNWIFDVVAETGGTVNEVKINVDVQIHLDCQYGYTPLITEYGCYLYDLAVESHNLAVVTFIGSHYHRFILFQKTDADVEHFGFVNGTMFFLPNGIGKIFKNLKTLDIGYNLRTKSIKRSNLNNMENLVNLYVNRNDIEALDEDVLFDLPNLEIFSLVGNHLKEMHGKTFERNAKLRRVSLNANQLEVLPNNLFKNNFLLESVNFKSNHLKIIDGRMFEANEKLWHVDLESNQLEVLPNNLFKDNLLLQLVFFSNNSLQTIDEKIFEKNRKLSSVYLNSNQLEVLPRNLFKNNLLLTHVFVSNNSLKIIDGETFRMNEKLWYVDLKSNQLEVLPSELFQSNLMLVYADFHDNALKIIATNFTVGFNRIQKIDFSYNLCIDAYYDKYILEHDIKKDSTLFRNLIEFQIQIDRDCSSPCISCISSRFASE